MTKQKKLAKVNESFTVHRYDNGWMIEISGKSADDDWITSKVLCSSEEELLEHIRTYNKMEVDN